MNNFLICLVFLVFSMSVFAECPTTSTRHVKGDEPLASVLYEAAKKAEMGSWQDGTFNWEVFSYLGSLTDEKGRKLYVTYLETIWGASSCRGSYRLIFFNEKMEQVGQYSSIEKPKFIGPNKLAFPYEDEPITEWEFKGKLPSCLEVADDCFELKNGKSALGY